MDCAVSIGLANCLTRLYCLLIVWVALTDARPSSGSRAAGAEQIPSSALFELTKVKTIEDLLQMLGQSSGQPSVISGQHINTPSVERKEPHINHDHDDDNSEDDDNEDEDESDFAGLLGGPKPVPVVLTEMAETKTSLTPSQLYDIETFPSCIPRESVIEVTSEASRPHVRFWPGCVTLRRCGGCCNSELFECQATKSVVVQRRVIQLEFNPRSVNSFQYTGVVAKNFSEDSNCSCQCKVKPQDCNPATQVHRNCQCQCQAKTTCPAKKEWDPFRCQCSCSASPKERVCPKVKEEWDEESCSCQCRKDIQARCRAPHRFNYRRCRCERRST